MRRFWAGDTLDARALPSRGPFAPLAREIAKMADSLLVARAAAEEEARLRDTHASRWTPTRLQAHVRSTLKGRPLIIVSNREPYLHVWRGRQVQCVRPPGGLVTAMDPILRACGGTWIAHGSGDADRTTTDARGRLRVPPEMPVYTLRRVWLDPAEERGYYDGFANEGLWPLCHIAHARPLFRADDWHHYVRVNAKFAEAVLEEIAGSDEPAVLIQDYHFALLPRLIKAQRPEARVALFWHIPWPNPEAFSICPWARELLHGMLGADLVGFHIQFHCNNFLETVDRLVESRIDREHIAITQAEHTTWVKPLPISVPVPEAPDGTASGRDDPPPKTLIERQLHLPLTWLGVGVDRLDYTKGIAERFLAIERFLEQHPTFRERFVFVELGAPSRTRIQRYRNLEAHLDAEVERINRRLQTPHWRPICFLKQQHRHEDVARFYRAADVCLVTSLHDGMNLVSKEFVAARTDHQGVLVLSQFTGASRELRDALIVNPYDIEQVAAALHRALTMEPLEREMRMRRMRDVLQEHNVYRWAASLVTELARLRPGAAPVSPPRTTGTAAEVRELEMSVMA